MKPSLEVFVDGDCPLCSREVSWLRRLDTHRQLRFTDISATDFDAAGIGRSYSELMRKIHARLPSGELVRGVEVFRQVYSRLGFHRAVRVSRWPLVRGLLDLGYVAFARSRLRLTGRCEVTTQPASLTASARGGEVTHA